MTLINAIESFEVSIPTTNIEGAAISLPGTLCLPAPPTGLVLFAHGSGSSRRSPRNALVASVLHESWIGTLLFDLLTEQEATDRVNVFDIGLLAERLLAAIRYVSELEQTRHLPLGQQADVEHVHAIRRLLFREQVEQERADPGLVQHGGHEGVAGAVATRTAAVGEEHEAGRRRRQAERARQRDRCPLDVRGGYRDVERLERIDERHGASSSGDAPSWST